MRLLLLIYVFLYCLVGVIQAAPTTNTTNTTNATTSDSFKAPSFTTRTIWSIVSSSILTLFTCIYSAIHPNIPSPKDSPLRILRRRLGIIIMALIAPELIVAWAMRQWISARRITRLFKESEYFKVSQPQEWSESHESIEAPTEKYAQGDDGTWLLLEHSEDEVPTLRYAVTRALTKPFKKVFKAYVSEQSEDYMWTQTHSFFVLMGGFMLYVDGKPYHTLQPDEVLKLKRAGCIDVPILTAKQIHDRGKCNAISKGLIMIQAAWFVMQLVVRAVYRLETTQLEVGTLAFAVLNFLTYAVWWNKPLNVQCPHPVYWKSTDGPEKHIVVSDGDKPTWFKILALAVSRPLFELIGSPDILSSPKLRVPTFDGSIKLEDWDKTVLLRAGLLMATIFGGIHCAAWSFTFHTYKEQVLWRMSAVAITFAPWIFSPANLTSDLVPDVVLKVYGLICLASALLYITARAALLVLMFTTLRNLPPDAYKAVWWTSLVPHL